jgi:D-alanine-D-alanine ligase
MIRKLRVGILFGGKSGEHDVSIASARSALAAIDRSKYEPVLIGIDRQGRWIAGPTAIRQLSGGSSHTSDRPPSDERVSSGADRQDGQAVAIASLRELEGNAAARSRSPLSDIDVVFPILHGPLGEDGTVQGLFEVADIPYVGAGVAASAVGMDKDLLKSVLRAHGLPLVDSRVVLRSTWDAQADQVVESLEQALPYPVFVKPANMGSSVGISKARNRAELREAIGRACAYDRKVLVEKGIEAREVECSILGNDQPIISVVGEVRTRRREFYDYVAKYTEGEADLIIPAELPAALSDEVRDLARRAYLAIDCAGMARADFFIEHGSGAVYVNELNTIPGFTQFSMYPKLWQATGLSYSELIDRLIQLALEKHAGKKRSGL